MVKLPLVGSSTRWLSLKLLTNNNKKKIYQLQTFEKTSNYKDFKTSLVSDNIYTKQE